MKKEISNRHSDGPVDEPQSKVKRSLANLVTLGLLKEEEKRKLIVTNPRIPRMYGLPKIHKPGFQIRPVVTTIDDPTSKIAQFLLRAFKKFKKFDSLSVKDNKQFLREIEDETIEEDEEMISFDVCALYPSIPRHESSKMMKEWISG